MKMIDKCNSVASTLAKVSERIETSEKREVVVSSKSQSSRTSKISESSESSKSKEKKHQEIIVYSDIEEVYCRICYDTDARVQIIYPCKCKGTMGAIHLECLERWLEESNRNSCELCGQQFQVERTPRYHALTSIFVWLCLNQEEHQYFIRSLRADLLRSLVVTPVTICCSYLCVVAADFYSKNNYDNFPPARWTTYSLLIMMTLLIFSYFVWMYMALHYHQRVWFYWWQKTSVVKVTFAEEVKGEILINAA
ncbi:E3 ubiquitin-protein ligase MARCH3-like [Cephus cinctus]|uniref:E3 ubiquitin-protein ligase MARCH3-like n=1 Tax=Cephus cinctus TaxID=211228 RepID=A0AAJ7CCH5_CEPCN|nr:E3 ubiquitin-protein ligase MARCH3-like [Cephus cinctus]